MREIENTLGPLNIRTGKNPLIGYREVVVSDTETTGLAPFGLKDDLPSNDPYGEDRICSATFLLFRQEEGLWVKKNHLTLVFDPDRPVPDHAGRVNGFTWSGQGNAGFAGRRDLKGEGKFEDKANEILDFIGDKPLVFHNAPFDTAFLDAELYRAGKPVLDVPILCTKKAFSDLKGLGRPNVYVPGTNLNALCDLLEVSRSQRIGLNGDELHGAEVDAELAARCFIKLNEAGWMEEEAAESQPHRQAGLIPAVTSPHSK